MARCKHILMIVENNYPLDIRVRKEAEALTEAGHAVAVIALRGSDQKAVDEIRGVKIYRIPKITIFRKTKRVKGNRIVKQFDKVRSIAGYVMEYAYFTTATFLVSLYVLLRHGFDAVHTHNPPDTLSVIGIFYRLLGKKYVFDHHDLAPELYLARVSGKKDLLYHALLFFEKLSCRFSNIIISTNESYKEIVLGRHSVDRGKIHIVRNNPILADCTFDGEGAHPDRKNNGKVSLLYLGSINPQDGVDVLLRTIRYLVDELGERGFLCTIVGDGDSLEAVQLLAAELGIAAYVDFKGVVTDRGKVKEYLSSSDIGIEPAPLNAANMHSTFIKVMEFMAAGMPVVAFDLKETRYSTDGAAVLIAPGDIEGFAHALKTLINAPDARKRIGDAGRKRITEELNWGNASQNLKNAYGALR